MDRWLLVVKKISENFLGSFESETAHSESTIFIWSALLIGESHVKIIESSKPSKSTEIHVEISSIEVSSIRLLEPLKLLHSIKFKKTSKKFEFSRIFSNIRIRPWLHLSSLPPNFPINHLCSFFSISIISLPLLGHTQRLVSLANQLELLGRFLLVPLVLVLRLIRVYRVPFYCQATVGFFYVFLGSGFRHL